MFFFDERSGSQTQDVAYMKSCNAAEEGVCV
jgi:hypothetical protein